MGGQRYAIDDQQITRIMGRLGVVDDVRDELPNDDTNKQLANRLRAAADAIYDVLNEVKKTQI